MTSTQLTNRQGAVYRFICKSIRNLGYPPTVREMCEEFDIGSPNGIACHLRALETKGVITRDSKVSRGIRLVGGVGDRCPLCGGVRK